jgi:hypothetical protein
MEDEDVVSICETSLSDSDMLRQRIALRAYELYEARNRVDGLDVEDWLQAEDEILGEILEPEKADAAGA